MLTLFFNAIGRVSWALATISKILIGTLILLVIADVTVRNLGYRPLGWAVNTSEFLLLYITFTSMPWLVRNKGHVFVEFLRMALPPGARAVLERLVYLGCVVLCLYLAWYAGSSFVTAIKRGTYEMRTFDMPKWAIFAPMAVAFTVSALEWLRFLVGHDSLYERDLLEVGGH